MDPAVWIFGSTTLSLGTLMLGKIWGARKKVDNDRCLERREACLKTVNEKLDNHTQTLKRIEAKLIEKNKKSP